MGVADTLTGVQDTSLGLSQIMKGNLFEGSLTAAQGFSDLGSGMVNFVIPAMKNMSKEMIGNAAAAVKSKVAMVGNKVATIASTAATKAMTIAQKGLNLAMRMNPIGLIITAIVALVAIVIVIEKKTGFFSKTWAKAWGKIKDVVAGVKDWISQHWPLILGILTGPIGIAVLVIRKNKDRIVDFFKSVPGAIKSAFKGLASFISLPFTTAFSAIKSLWNSTVGGFGFSVPGFVPGIGGESFNIPMMHTGGVMPGAPGSQGLALLMAGERISPAGASGGSTVLEIHSGGTAFDDALVEVLRRAIRVKGGNVQVVLGR